eukprot:TRINITY_DN18900_c0_g1_i1.p1 TRINITY_DN18900_c0_g1~~TRINITY_DN18900_c0_g1_i1.p1  ORF type:complete len:358 (+),score=15.56 TRINITY_DN18900_c0_g1_i1:32-1075(+)
MRAYLRKRLYVISFISIFSLLLSFFYLFHQHYFFFTNAPFKQNQRTKYVWSYWGQGQSQLSSFMQLNIRCWKSVLQGEWEIRILDANPRSQYYYLNYVQMSDLPNNFQKFSYAKKSDCIKLALLEKYGGVWMDVSTILIKKLDSWVEYEGAQPKGMTGFYTKYYGSAKFKRKDFFETWFIASNRNSPLLQKWRENFINYYNTQNDGVQIWEHQMYKHLNLSNLIQGKKDFRSQLPIQIAFRKAIEDDKTSREYWKKNMTLTEASETAYIIPRLIGTWDGTHICDLLFNDNIGIQDSEMYNKILAQPIIKFNKGMYSEVKKLSEEQLLSQHTIMGRVYKKLLSTQQQE